MNLSRLHTGVAHKARHRRFRWRTALAVAAGVAVAAPSVAAVASVESSSGETIRIAVGGFGTEHMDPAMMSFGASAELLLPMYDTLLELGENNSLAPGLATEWSVADDQVTYTFTLRDDAEFHDGWGPVTAADVEFSLNRWIDEDAASASGPELRAAMKSVTALDEQTVEIVANKPGPELLYLLAPYQQLTGVVFSEKYLTEEAGDDFLAQAELMNEHPIGSGPFEFVSHTRGQSVVYQALESHWRATPVVGEVEFLLIPEPATRMAMLQAGEVDIIPVTGDDASQAEEAGFGLLSVPTAMNVALYWSGTYREAAEGKPTADPRVRHALSLAIDRQAILDTIMGGAGQLPTAPWNNIESTQEADWDYFADWAAEVHLYDPDKARELLADAGYPDGFSGLQMFSFTREGADFGPRVAEVVVAQWAAIGVEAEIVNTDYGAYRDHLVNADINDSTNAGDVSVMSVLPKLSAVDSLVSYFAYFGEVIQLTNDPEIEAAIHAAQDATTPEEREALVRAAYDLVNAQWVGVPLFIMDSQYAHSDAVSGWSTYPGWPFFGRMLETLH